MPKVGRISRFRILVGTLILLGVFLFGAYIRFSHPQTAIAATNSTLNFQARLLANTGRLVPDGNYHIEFKLYDQLSGGTALWTETRTTGSLVRVVNGYFSVNLGSVDAFPGNIDWDQDLWLTMNIGGGGGSPVWDGEMTPRIKLTGVPYAFRAGQLVKNTGGGNVTTLDFASPSGINNILLPAASGTVCLNNNNCNYASSTTAVLQGGNSFGTDMTIGTNDNFALNFETNGTTKMTILQSGDVGIGTVAPANRLHLSTSSAGTTEYALRLVNASTSNNTGTGITFTMSDNETIDFASIVAVRTNSPASQNTDLIFSTSQNSSNRNIERLRITGVGNVGIGTNNPAYKLEIIGTVRSSSNLSVGGNFNTSGNIQTTSTTRLTAAGVLQNVTHADAGNFFTGGTLGVARGGTGASSVGSAGSLAYSDGSTYAFTAVGTSGECLLSAGAGTPTWGSCIAGAGDILQGGNTFGTDVTIGSNDEFALNFETFGTTKMTILPNGNVGIGTVSPSDRLYIENAISGSGSAAGLTIRNNNSANASTAGVTLLNNTGDAFMRFYSSGSSADLANTLYFRNTAGGHKFVATSGSTIGFGIGSSASAADDLVITSAGNVNVQNALQTGGTTRLTNGGVLQNVTNANAGTFFTGGTLGVDRGGTGAGSVGSAGSVAFSNGSIYAFTGVGTSGQCLLSAGSGSPTWGGCDSVNTVLQGGNSFGGDMTIGTNDNFDLYFETNGLQNALLDTSGNFIVAGNYDTPTGGYATGGITRLTTAGVLQNVTNANAGTFFTGGTLTVARGGTGIGSVGAAGSIAYSDGNTYAFSSAGTSGQCLLSGGTGAPTWGGCITGAGDILQGGNSFGTDMTIGTNDAYALNFKTEGTTKMTILPDGNVGVGVNDPDARLTIANVNVTSNQINLRSSRVAIASGNILGGIGFSSNDTNLTAPGILTASIQAIATATHTASVLDTALVFSTTSGTTTSEVMRITGNNRVGIGTVSPTATLNVTTAQPAAGTGGTGSSVGSTLTVTGGVGGNTTIATTGTGGVGGTITLTGGIGGQATQATTQSTGGAGGSVTIQGGVGGAASVADVGNNTGGAGGAISLTAGTGGAATLGSGNLAGGNGGALTLSAGTGGVGATNGGNGGTATLQGGAASAAQNSNGGAVAINGRAGSSVGTGGAGGAITLAAGAAGGDNTVNRAGGAITLTAGASRGPTQAGGAITLTAGAGGQNMNTGTVTGPSGGGMTLTSGTGGRAVNADIQSTGGNGGTLAITGGAGGAASVAGTGNNTGGNGAIMNVIAGTGGAANGATSGDNRGGNGGNLLVRAGTGGAATVGSGSLIGGTGGILTLQGGTGGAGATSAGNGGDLRINGGVASSSAGTGGAVVFQTAAANSLTERARITSVGNFGIGVTNASRRLTVSAPNATTTQLGLQSARAAIVTGNVIGGIDFISNDTQLADPGVLTASIQALAAATHTASVLTTDLVFSTTTGTTTSEAFRLTGAGNGIFAGNVGIGTTNPSTLLEVASTTTSIGTFTSSHTAGGNVFFNATATGGRSYAIQSTADTSAYGGGKLVFRDVTDASARMTIDSNGSVGIGTTGPGQLLDVQGGNINTSGTIMTGGTTRITAAGVLQNVTANVNILTAGTLGISRGGTGNDVYTTNGVLYYDGVKFVSTALGNNGQCLTGTAGAPVWATCSGLVTLQNAYTASSTPEIVVDATRGALTIRDASSPIGANLFEVQNNAGNNTYLGVNTSGISVFGSATISNTLNVNAGGATIYGGITAQTSNVNIVAGTLQTSGTTRLTNAGVLQNVTNADAGTFFTGGTLDVARGGTGAGSVGSAGSIAYSNGSAYAFSATGTTGQCLVSGGTGAPTWTSCTAGAGDILQGGNSFGTAMTIGTNDNFALNFETNGSTSMTILANGNVGIGTSSPDSNLQIEAASPELRLRRTDNANGHSIVFQNSGNNSTIRMYSTGSTTADLRFALGNSPTLSSLSDVLILENGGNINVVSGSIQTNGTTRLTNAGVLQNVTANTNILTAGTLGIGRGGTGNDVYTTNGVVYYDGVKFVSTGVGNNGQCLTGTAGAPVWSNCSGLVTLQNAYTASSSPEIIVDATRGALTIRDAATPIGANLFEVQNNAGTNTYLGVDSSGINVFGSATVSNTLNVNAGGATIYGNVAVPTGNLGIGTSSPGQSLHILSGATPLLLDRNSTNNVGIQFRNNSSSLFVGIDNNATNFAVGTTNNLSSSALFTVARTSGNVNIATGDLLTAGTVRLSNAGVLQNVTNADAGTFFTGGTLGVALGGTGVGSVGSAGSIAYSNGSTYAFTAAGTSGQCLTSNGSGAPTWASCAAGTGDILQNGNSFGADMVIGTNDGYGLSFETAGNLQATINVGGATTFKNSTNSANAFRVQDAGSVDVFNVNTTNKSVNIGVANSYGTSMFAAPVNYTSGSGNYGVVTADVNNDGYPDIITVNSNEDSVSVFLNNGDGTFAAKADYSTIGNSPVAVVATDLNGDDWIDLVTADEGSNTISILANIGGSGFIAVDWKTTDWGPSSITAVENWGYPTSIVTSNQNGTISVFENWGGFFLDDKVDYITDGVGFGIASADVDNDTYEDIIVTNYNNAVSVMINNGDDTFAPMVEYTVGGLAWDVTTGDVDNDGYPDIITTNPVEGTASVLINNGDGTFATKVDYTINTPEVSWPPVGITLADVNNDTYLDIVATTVSDTTISTLLNNGDGTFATKVDHTTGSYPVNVASADFDDDGYLDVVTTDWGTTVSVLINTGSSGPSSVTANLSVRTASANNSALILQASVGQAVDILRVQDSNGEALFNVSGNGNVGIGVNNPAQKLTVAGNIAATGTISGTLFSGSGSGLTSLNASFLSSGTVPNARLSGSYTGLTGVTGSGNATFARFLGSTSDSATAPSFSWGGDTNNGMFYVGTDSIGFSTAGTERWRITNTGTLQGASGALITSPGSMSVTSGLGSNLALGSGLGGAINLTAGDGGGAINMGGNVRIGSAPTGYRLAVLGSQSTAGEDVMLIKSVNDSMIFKMGANGDTENMLLSLTNNEAASKNFAIAGFGLGTIARFRVAAQQTYLEGNGGASSYILNMYNQGNVSTRHGIRVQAGANNASGTTYYLDAYDGDGDRVGYIANVSGTFQLVNISDARTKTNINNSDIGGLDVINQLRVVDYNRTSDPNGPRITGFIAQEVQGIYAQAVTEDDRGYLGIATDAFIPVLVRAVQEQQGQIISVQGENLSQNNSISLLGNRVNNLEQQDVSALNNRITNAEQRLHSVEAQLASGNFNALNVAGLATITNLTVTGSATVNGSITVGHNLTVNNNLKVQGTTTVANLFVEGKIVTRGAKPQVEKGEALENSDGTAKIEVSGNDSAGTLSINTGALANPSEPFTSGVLANVTFSSPYNHPPRVVITPTNADAVGLPVFIEKTPTGFKVILTQQATPGKTYSFDYIVLGSEEISQP